MTVSPAPVLKVISFDPLGEKVEIPLAVNVWLEATVAPPLKVESPDTPSVPVMEVLPLRLTAPVPVENVPAPVCEKLPVSLIFFTYRLFHTRDAEPRSYVLVTSGPTFPATCSANAEGVVVPIPTFPFCVMTNLFNPLEDAVKRSPTPELSTTSPAKDVAPETDAVASVPLRL